MGTARPGGASIAALDRDRLVGSWRLVSWEVRYADGTVTRPFGRRPSGLLLYTADGGMSANIAARSRKRLSGANPREAPVEERARAFDTFFAYAGRFSIRGSTVRHRVTIAINPAMTGTVQVREARLAGGRLELAASERLRGRGGRRSHLLVWARATAAGGG